MHSTLIVARFWRRGLQASGPWPGATVVGNEEVLSAAKDGLEADRRARRLFRERAALVIEQTQGLRGFARQLAGEGEPIVRLVIRLYRDNAFLRETVTSWGWAAPIVFIMIQALQVMRDIYRNGMSDEVFAWTAASNNQAFLAGRLSVALNAISIVRSAEDSGNQALSDDTWLASIPRGPARSAPSRSVAGA